MKDNTQRVLDMIVASEGGFTVDRGGPTDRGVTQKVYDAWRAMRGLPPASVKGITAEEAGTIFFNQYLSPVRFDLMPSGVDYAAADFSVNSGPVRAAKELQKVLGFSGPAVDGVVGVRTLAELDSHDPLEVIDALCDARLVFMRGLSNWEVSKNGWQTRVERVRVDARRMAADKPLQHADAITPAAPARDVNLAVTTLLGKVAADPVALAPLLGPVLVPLASSSAVQIALAGILAVTAAWALMRATRRDL